MVCFVCILSIFFPFRAHKRTFFQLGTGLVRRQSHVSAFLCYELQRSFLINHALLCRYCDRIQEALYEIKRSAKSVKPENKEDIKKLLKLVSSFLHAIVPWSLDADDLDFSSVRVEDEAYAEELGRLQREYAEMQEQRIQPLLDDTVIDDEASLTAIIGHSRIEIVRYTVQLAFNYYSLHTLPMIRSQSCRCYVHG